MKYRGPVILGITILIIGVFVSGTLGWYYFFPRIDKVFHFMGGVALGWFFYIYFSLNDSQFSKINKLLILISTTCLIAVGWEFIEHLSSLYSPQYVPWLFRWIRGGDLNDTLLDLLAGMIGGLFFGILNLSKK